MTARETEEWLGIKPSSEGRALLKHAFRREKETGKRFIVRLGGRGKGTRYRFTREIVRRHLRELWQTRFDRLATRATATMQRIEAHIDRHIDERIEKHPMVRGLADRQDETIDLLESLAATVERTTRVAKSRKESHT
jgi:hypothetical protein